MLGVEPSKIPGSDEVAKFLECDDLLVPSSRMFKIMFNAFSNDHTHMGHMVMAFLDEFGIEKTKENKQRVWAAIVLGRAIQEKLR